MILDRVRAYLSGSVVVKIRGVDLEKLINAASSKGIVLASVKRHGRYLLTARTAMSDCRRLRALAPLSRYKIEVIGKHGLPLLLGRMRSRRMLIAGVVAFVALLYYMSSFVWFVRITGLETLPEASIRQFIESQGVRPGIRKSDVDAASLERDLAILFPRLSWVAVRLRGTLLSIDVAEKLSAGIDGQKFFDVVAAKPGLVVKFIPLAGRPLIEEGYTVEAGQVLVQAAPVDGFHQEATEGDAGSSEGKQIVSARAIVEARVWYQASAEVRLIDREVVRTGRKKVTRSLHIMNWDIPIGWSGKQFDQYECEEHREVIPLWPGSRIGLNMTVRTYHEVVEYPVSRTIDQAKSEAIRLARASALAEVPDGVEVVDEIARVAEIGEGENVRVEVEYTVETIEDIGLEKPAEIDLSQESVS